MRRELLLRLLCRILTGDSLLLEHLRQLLRVPQELWHRHLLNTYVGVATPPVEEEEDGLE